MILAIDVAISHLGIKEDTGKNDGIPAEMFMGGEKLPWCAGALMYWFKASDGPDLPPNRQSWWKYRAVRNMKSGLWQRGYTFGFNILPQKNDIIFFGDRGDSDKGPGDHVGIIDEVKRVPAEPTEYQILTIEGNKSNAVSRGLYAFGAPRITGFARMHPLP